MPNLTANHVQSVGHDDMEPGERECLRCYVMRMVSEYGCDNTHRWVTKWRDLRAPRSKGLLQWLSRRGGVCCDCEVMMNVWPDYPVSGRLLPCAGVSRPGSTDPCHLNLPEGMEQEGIAPEEIGDDW
jgi:hypothetical protein